MALVFEPKKRPEFLERFASKVSSILPPGLRFLSPPSPKETGEAWKEVVTEKPEEKGSYLPFLPKINLNKLGTALYGTANTLASAPGIEMIQPLQIRAFHGSPYKFNKFSNKAIGTGEGAQAFGYGHYLSESEKVAGGYAERGAKSRAMIMGKVIENEDEAVKELADYLGTKFKTMPLATRRDVSYFTFRYPEMDANSIVASGIGMKPGHPSYDDVISAINEAKKNITINKNLYETTIHKGKQPSEYTYLEWDKPVSDGQRQKIKSAFIEQRKQIGRSVESDYITNQELSNLLESQPSYWGEKRGLSGQNLYHQLSQLLGSNKEASNLLQRAGISGIKYPTGSLSGIKGSKEYNYVVFNPEDITIESVK